MQSAILGAIIVAALLALTVPHLDSQGFYYDELHQAPAAFHYIGKHPIQFTWRFHGIPVFNMPYSGAIKSTIYGLYLRYINPQFTAFNWRMFGIIFVSVGVLFFYLAAGQLISLATGILLGLMILTDSTAILTTRFDWGPTALSLGLRMVLLATWLSIELDAPSALKYAIVGFIAGFAVFEKLSSVVLMPALFVLLISSLKTDRKAWIAGLSGIFAGTIPLVLANISSYRGAGFLISLSGAAGARPGFTPADIYDHAFQFLSLGQGVMSRDQILGEPTRPIFANLEAGAILFLLLTIVIAAWRFRREHRSIHLAGALVVAYVVICISFFLMPRGTFIHHWIVATPFHYLAIALALPALMDLARTRHTRLYVAALTAGLTVLMTARVVTVYAIESSLIAGKASAAFAPALNRVAEIAAAKTRNAVFVSSDWGSGTQIYCFSNGQDDFVYEPFWSTNPAQATTRIAAQTNKNILYIVTTHLSEQFDAAARQVEAAMASADGWREAPLDGEFAGLNRIDVRKFVRSAPQ
jgi:hypothetical protein